MGPRFGTDGVRGLAGSDLTAELALALGRAAAASLAPPGVSLAEGHSHEHHRRAFLVARDTRWSGPMLQAAFSAGVASEGVDVINLGVAPTPAAAALSAARQIPAAVISASHNAFADNGIKLFAAGGRKLAPEQEGEVARLAAERAQTAGGPVTQAGIGRLMADPEGLSTYAEAVLASLGGRTLGGIRVVLDCADGAAYGIGPALVQAAGARLVGSLGVEPDGININAEGGATDPSRLAEAVKATGAALGLALDGDADRVIAVDETGEVVDGDRMIALFALDLHGAGRLRGDTVVATVMANLGFHKAMARGGIAVHTTPVGDRRILDALASGGWSLGGEQSGHVIFPDLATTGDGMLTGLLLADLMVRSGSPLSELAGGVMQRFPQVLRNVAVQAGRPLDDATLEVLVGATLDEVRGELGDGGRVLLRPSGTEPVVRVMVEAPTEDEAAAAAERLAGALDSALSGP
ncbi:MAG: phosphoglucosamine mutase [Acidimicrobiales bacterium]